MQIFVHIIKFYSIYWFVFFFFICSEYGSNGKNYRSCFCSICSRICLYEITSIVLWFFFTLNIWFPKTIYFSIKFTEMCLKIIMPELGIEPPRKGKYIKEHIIKVQQKWTKIGRIRLTQTGIDRSSLHMGQKLDMDLVCKWVLFEYKSKW